MWLASPNEDNYNRYAEELFELASEQLLIIGTVGFAPLPVIVGNQWATSRATCAGSATTPGSCVTPSRTLGSAAGTSALRASGAALPASLPGTSGVILSGPTGRLRKSAQPSDAPGDCSGARMVAGHQYEITCNRGMRRKCSTL